MGRGKGKRGSAGLTIPVISDVTRPAGNEETDQLYFQETMFLHGIISSSMVQYNYM